MDAYVRAAVGLFPFNAGIPNGLGPVSEVADKMMLVYHGRDRGVFSVFGDPPPASKRFPVVNWARNGHIRAGRKILWEL